MDFKTVYVLLQVPRMRDPITHNKGVLIGPVHEAVCRYVR
jgi:hypothetical protein